MTGSLGYRVRLRVQGELSSDYWLAMFGKLAVNVEPGGTTILLGELPDQAALHGLLATIRDLGLTLVSVETSATAPAEGRLP